MIKQKTVTPDTVWVSEWHTGNVPNVNIYSIETFFVTQRKFYTSYFGWYEANKKHVSEWVTDGIKHVHRVLAIRLYPVFRIWIRLDSYVFFFSDPEPYPKPPFWRSNPDPEELHPDPNWKPVSCTRRVRMHCSNSHILAQYLATTARMIHRGVWGAGGLLPP